MKISKTSVALLLIQLAIVSTVAAKYLYERWVCPKVWVRTVAIDPELLMRGRYLSMRLVVDGCQSTLPTAKAAQFSRGLNGAAVQGPFVAQRPMWFRANLKVEKNRLLAIALANDETGSVGEPVMVPLGAGCDAMQLENTVDFFISEHEVIPPHLGAGQELWVEVTVPPKGQPRPVQLALKENSAWRPLASQ